jgi:phosphoglycolate phosphatase-like HAD superfamily hydrolase
MKVVVFDFDGVIIPSEEIKQNGYRWMFSEFGEDVPEEAIRAARAEFSNARGNRYDIIRSVLTRIGKTDDLDEMVRLYAKRFGEIVQSRLENFRVEPKVLGMLEKLSKKHALYINSNTPDEPLRETLKSLGIEYLFKGVFGSSDGKSKAQRLRDVAAAESVTATEMVFVGDGEGDRDAAVEFGCEFLGVGTESNGWKDGTSEFKVLTSISEMDERGERGFERMV